MKRYTQALMTEISLFAAQVPSTSLVTIYVGGGTPSTWPDQLLLDTSDRIRNVVCTQLLTEVTIEVNPGSVLQHQPAFWRSIGINRLSIGVQYGDDEILAKLGRYQKMTDVYGLLSLASREFDNISVDLMLGLPGVERGDWQRFIAEVVLWPVTHVSMYCLTVYERTPLHEQVARGHVLLPDDDEVAAMYCWSADFLERHGFKRYEVSSFARTTYESRHNGIYWDRKPYKGCGVAACSFDGARRFRNNDDLEGYMTSVECSGDPIVFSEHLSHEEVRHEVIMLGLRRARGVSYHELTHTKTPDECDIINKKIEQFCQAELMSRVGDCLVLTNAGYIVEQRIAAELI